MLISFVVLCLGALDDLIVIELDINDPIRLDSLDNHSLEVNW